MFTDFLYQQINTNLRGVETTLFPDISQIDMKKAVKLLEGKTPIDGDSKSEILARYLFARTLKEQLEKSASELTTFLHGKDALRNSLFKIYMYSVAKTDIYLGCSQSVQYDWIIRSEI